MSEESIHDIIREMMNCTAVKSRVPHSTVEDILNPPIVRFNLEQRAIVRDFAYRIAAAEERSKTTEPEKNSGNAAALREALEDSNGLLAAIGGEWREAANGQIADNRAALAAPARNCDVGTAEEQFERFSAFCKSGRQWDDEDYCSSKCPLDKCGGWCEVGCAFHWSQMPFAPAEGGAE